MKSILITGFLLASSVAHSALNFDFRFDSDATSYTDDTANKNSTKYTVQTGRVDWTGKVNDNLSFRTRLRFNKPAVASSNVTTGAPANTTRDSVNDAVDFAYLAHKMDATTLTIGKFASEMGGFEGAMSGADHYLTSKAYSAVNLYVSGFKVGHIIDNHEVLALVTDIPDGDVKTNGTKFDQSSGMLGLAYKGSFMEKTVNLIVSHHEYEPSAIASDEAKYAFNLVGVKYTQPTWTLSLDYSMNSYKDKTTAGETDSLNTANIEFAYLMDQWTAKLKLESSADLVKTSATTEAKTNYTGYALAAEYKPIDMTGLRYHMAYTTRATKADGASTTPTESHFIIGARLLADFLK